MNLNREQFLAAVERGNTLLEELRADYPELKLSPVFSRFGPRSGQCAMTSDLKKIVMEFPEMLAGEAGGRKPEDGGRKAEDSNWGFCSRKRTQRAQKVGTDRRAVRNSITGNGREKAQEAAKRLRNLLFAIRAAEKDGEKEVASKLWKQADEEEGRLLDPDLKLYCGDVLIEYRPTILKYESLRRLQQDPRLPQELNEVGNVRVVAGSLEMLAG
jgi:hypothetical protein